jgi:malate dehydrogenase (oxaloacetate-decarboxylating)(NADP+)
VGGTFTQNVVESMSRINERPVILALSNPTDHAECTAEQAYTWSSGKAIYYAAGVQFPPVHLSGRTFLSSQANNFYVFPATGMAVFATQAARVTDEMFIEGAGGGRSGAVGVAESGAALPVTVQHSGDGDSDRGTHC